MEHGSWLFGEPRKNEFRLQFVPSGHPRYFEFDLQLMLLEGATWALWTFRDTGDVLQVLRAPQA